MTDLLIKVMKSAMLELELDLFNGWCYLDPEIVGGNLVFMNSAVLLLGAVLYIGLFAESVWPSLGSLLGCIIKFLKKWFPFSFIIRGI